VTAEGFFGMLSTAEYAHVPVHSVFQYMDQGVDANFLPEVSYPLAKLDVFSHPAFSGVDTDFIGRIMLRILQQLAGHFWIVLVRSGIFRSYANSAFGGSVAEAFYQTSIQGLYQYFAVNGVGQGLPDRLLAQLGMSYRVQGHEKDPPVGAALGLGCLLLIFCPNLCRPIGLAHCQH
jgi:hypothetical protein